MMPDPFRSVPFRSVTQGTLWGNLFSLSRLLK